MDRGQAVSHYIDRQAHLLTSGPLQLQHGEPITRCCSFWHIMFFRNQIIAPLLFNSALLHYFFLPLFFYLLCMFPPKAPPQLPCQIFFFSTILWVFQAWLSVNIIKINMMRIDSLWSRCFTEATFKKWGDFLESAPYDKNVSVSKFLARNSRMWKQPQIMVDLSRSWWREETSWLSHVVVHYSSKSSRMCSAHTSARHSGSRRAVALATQAALLDSHPLLGINIVFGGCKYEMLSHGKPWSVFERKNTLLIFFFFWKAGNTLDLRGDLKNLPSCDWDISIKQHAIERHVVTASNLICKDEYYSETTLGRKKHCYNTKPGIFYLSVFCFREVLSLETNAICTQSYPVAGIIVVLIVIWCLPVAKNRKCHVARCLGVCFWPW